MLYLTVIGYFSSNETLSFIVHGLVDKEKKILKFFSVVGSGSCPECNVPLRRTNFRLQLFEDAIIDKEVDIRRRILRQRQTF